MWGKGKKKRVQKERNKEEKQKEKAANKRIDRLSSQDSLKQRWFSHMQEKEGIGREGRISSSWPRITKMTLKYSMAGMRMVT